MTHDVNKSKIGGQFHQHVYVQLLRIHVLKAQRQSDHRCLFALLGSERIKAARKMLAKLTHAYDIRCTNVS